MNFKDSAIQVVKAIGGKENVSNITHCVTRVRLVLKDETKVDMETLKTIPGISNVVVSGGQYQLVIGAKVNEMYDAVVQEVGTIEVKEEKAPEQKKGVVGFLKGALDTVISCFVPFIPVIAGAGMLKVVCVLLSYAGIIEAGSTTYTLLNDVIADGVYYFLPFFVAHNAAKKMGVNPLTAMAFAAVILHPKFLALLDSETPVTFFGLPVQVIDYSTQAIPMILGVWLLKYVDKFAEKISPSVISIFSRTLIDLIVVAPIMILVLGPISMGLSNALFAACTAMMSWGWIAVGINALIFPLMVLTGTHNATIPLIIQMFMTQGYDPIFLVSGLAVNIAQGGAACAVALKTKNKVLKSTALSATVSAVLGITEPALYGVNLRLKRPFISMMIGAFIGGCFCGILGLAAPTFATPSLLTCAIFVPAGKNMLLGFLAVLVSFAITFALTWVIGFKDLEADE